MAVKTLLIAFVMTVTSLSACGDSGSNPLVKSLLEKLTDKVEEKVADYLKCSDTIQSLPIDVEAIHDALTGDDPVALDELLMGAADASKLVSLLGFRLEAIVLIARNLTHLAGAGHLAALKEKGWDGLECDDAIDLQCTLGSATSTVQCAEGKAHGITVAYSDCTLSGATYNGTVQVAAVDGDASAADLTFSDFSTSKNKVLMGALRLNLDGGSAVALSLESGDSFKIVSHGGPGDGAPSCAQSLTINVLRVSAGDGTATVELDGVHETNDGMTGLKTKGAHMTWKEPVNCLCPIAGSALEMEISNPLGDADDTAIIDLSYEPSSSPALCTSATVTATQWPTECSLVEKISADCGRAATEKILTPTLSALCVAIPQ